MTPTMPLTPKTRTLAAVFAAALAAGALTVVVAPSASAGRPTDAPKEPVNSCHSRDNTDPNINLLRLQPSNLNVTGGAKTLTVRTKLSDDGGPGPKSGVSGATVTLTSVLDPNHYFNVTLRRAKQPFTWTGTQVFPRGIVGGDWQVSTVFVTDKAGNSRILSYGDLNLPAYDRDLNVTSNEDSSAPELVHVTLKPKRVDTRKKPRSVVFTARVQDNGGAGVGGVSMELDDDKGHSTFANLTHVKGRPDLMHGSAFIPQWQGRSRWYIDAGTVYDRVGNTTSYARAQMAALGDHAFRMIGRRDTVKPRISGFHLSTRQIDVRKKAKSVAMGVRVHDGLAGAQFAYVVFSDQQGPIAFEFLRPTGTNPHNVAFKGTFHVRPCDGVRPGSYKVQVLAYDAAGNQKIFPRGRFAVKAKDRTSPTISLTAFAQEPESVKLNFSEAVDGISTSSVIVTEATDNAPSIPFNAPVCYPEVGLGGSPVDCLTGHVRSVNLVPITALTPNSDYYVIVNPEGVLDVTDFAGNPFQQARLLFEAEM